MSYKNKEVQKAYQRLWIAKRRRDFFESKVCVICGSADELELDHIDPKTKITHAVWSWKESRRREELDKCQVLCVDCHMDKTIAQRPSTDHGRGQMYQKYKCRCVKCRAWKRDSDKKYRG